MRTDLTIVNNAGYERDICIEAPSDTRWGDVGLIGTTYYAGQVAISADAVVGEGLLHAGAVIRGAPTRTGPPSGPTLDVIAGRNSGQSVRLTSSCIVGRDPSCDLVLDDPDVSRRHLEVTVHAGEVVARDIGSTHSTLVEEAPLATPQKLKPGDVVQIGRTYLIVRSGADPDVHSTAKQRPITMPAQPAPVRTDRALTPMIIAAAVPTALAVGFAFMFGAAQMLLFALLTPASMVASSWASRVSRRRDAKEGEATYQRLRTQALRELTNAVARETTARRQRSYDPCALRRILASTATLPLSSPTITLGLGSDTASIEVRGGAVPELWAVPVTIDLRSPLSVHGPRDLVDGLLRWLLCQLAATYDADLVLVATQRPDDWHWARWLPRLTVAFSPAERGQLTRLVDNPRPTFVINVDDAVISASAPPESTTAARVISLMDGAVLQEPDRSTSFAATFLDLELAEEIARGLASTPARSGDGVPVACRITDVLNLDATSLAASVAARWTQTPGVLQAVVGRGANGAHTVDLDADGPHALIAGTTGSGKSELLKVLVLSLAASYSPADVTFVLIDYKGGAAFAECAALPHTVGFVTDLDVATTRRALQSLAAELRRREAALAAVGAADLTAYRSTGAQPPLPRLVIVVDEFAALTTELPGFIPGLVDIAQRGRSLGLHLVLATQRPAGVVSPEIRANTPLRIALRTVSTSDSLDVLETTAAAGIRVDTPGRAIQRGSPEQVFQAAQASVSPPVSTDCVVLKRLGRWRQIPAESVDDSGPTEGELLSRAIVSAASAAGCPAPTPPWLPPLPTVVALDDPRLETAQPLLPIGVVDLPERQRQEPLTVDLIDGGGIVLVGGPRSGRSTGLLAIARGAAAHKSPLNLEIYGIDCAGRGLAPLSRLPHTGTNAALDDGFAAIARLVQRLVEHMTQRRDRVQTGGRTPLVLVLVDGWAAFAAASEEFDVGRTSGNLLTLVRDAAGAGVTVVIAGDRTALTPRLGSAVRTRLVLGFPDAQDYAIAGVDASKLPVPPVPGRGVRAHDGAVFQLINPTHQSAWLNSPVSPRAIRVRALPQDAKQSARRAGYLCLGVGGDAIDEAWIDHRSGAQLLIAGRPRSGRSTVLSSFLRQLVEAEVSVVVAAPERSPLHQQAIRLGVPPLMPDSVPPEALLIDDSEAFLDTAIGTALEAWIRANANTFVAVAARSDDPSINIRGLAYLVRRRRTGLLLRPGPVDGELLGHRLRRDQLGGPPGRCIVVGEPAWGAGFDEPLAVQTFSG